MTLRLNGATSGYTEIDAPAVAGNNNLKLPGGNGSDGNILGTDGAGNLSWVNGRMVLETAKASTSGTSVDFTGIPSWVKRVTVMLSGVSTNGTSVPTIQIGSSSGFETSSYQGSLWTSNTNNANISSGFALLALPNDATGLFHASVVITLLGSNTWVGSGVVGRSDTTNTSLVAGSKTLSGTLDRIRVTTIGGTNTFDAGSINILYEG